MNKHNVDVKAVLLVKRDNLIVELKQIDEAISQVQEEYSMNIERLQEQKKPPQEALQHVEALLKLEENTSSNRDDIKRANAAIGTGAAYIIDATFNLLEELHQPMHYKDITSDLQERRIYIPGKDPSATLLSKMSRDSRFKRVKRGTYALSTWRIRASKSKSTKTRKPKKR